MYVGSPDGFVFSYVAFGFLSVLVASAYEFLGIVGLLTFALPLVLARQLFRHRHDLAEAAGALRERQELLRDVQSRISEERRDERLALAGELHDEVLPPLFKVHLMGQVLRQNLNTGRLLELDDDLPELLEATEVAQTAIRDLVGNLRRSSLGPGGLSPSIEAVANQLEAAGAPTLKLELTQVSASRSRQLVIYQVAREAMSNAARYSRGSQISVKLTVGEGEARILISDDGVGFDPAQVDRDRNFGLQLIASELKQSEEVA